MIFGIASCELVCDYGEDTCESYCTADVCEYHWEAKHRHSMSWRTYDEAMLRDYPVKWNAATDNFDIVEQGEKSPNNPPLDSDKNVKNPLKELRNILTLDGRASRRIITINGQFPGPTIKVQEGSVVKVTIKNELPFESLTLHWHGLHQTE